MSMDQSTGAERERVVQQKRTDARKRVQAAQDKEITTRVEQRALKQQQADERARERSRAADNVAAAPATRGFVEREDEGVEREGTGGGGGGGGGGVEGGAGSLRTDNASA